MLEELDKERKLEAMRTYQELKREVKITLLQKDIPLTDILEKWVKDNKKVGITRQGFYLRLKEKPFDTIEKFHTYI